MLILVLILLTIVMGSAILAFLLVNAPIAGERALSLCIGSYVVATAFVAIGYFLFTFLREIILKVST